jgi:hypothetical protein
MAERDLDRELSELSVAWPPTPALADAVGRRLRAADPRRRWRRAVVPASALALLAGGLTFSVSAQPGQPYSSGSGFEACASSAASPHATHRRAAV